MDFWYLYFIEHREHFPKLLFLVERLITAQVNSACNERIFSVRKEITTNKRNKLKITTVDKIIRIYKNSPCVEDTEQCKKFYEQCAEEFWSNE